MPQTLLALLAMILASLVSMSQKRNTVATYEAMLDNEVEMAASGVTMHVLEMIGGRSFDERSTPDGIYAVGTLPSGPADFSAVSAFGSDDRGSDGCNLEEPFQTPACDDIDDLDGLRDVVVNAHFSEDRAIPFDVDVDVEYVTDADLQTPSSAPTRHKLVTVTLRSPFLYAGAITVERVFSYDPIKAEMDYETEHGPLGI